MPCDHHPAQVLYKNINLYIYINIPTCLERKFRSKIELRTTSGGDIFLPTVWQRVTFQNLYAWQSPLSHQGSSVWVGFSMTFFSNPATSTAAGQCWKAPVQQPGQWRLVTAPTNGPTIDVVVKMVKESMTWPQAAPVFLKKQLTDVNGTPSWHLEFSLGDEVHVFFCHLPEEKLVVKGSWGNKN